MDCPPSSPCRGSWPPRWRRCPRGSPSSTRLDDRLRQPGRRRRCSAGPPPTLVGRNIWVALPELGGTIFHSFLLHARSAGTPVTWAGFYPPADRWLTATAVLADGLLHVSFRPPTTGSPSTGRAAASPGRRARRPVRDADRDRLRFLAEVSEAMIGTLDTGESAARLAELVAPRLCDWAVVALVGDDGGRARRRGPTATPSRYADLRHLPRGRLRGPGDETPPLVDALLTGEPVQLAADRPGAVDAVAADRGASGRRGGGWTRRRCTIVPLRARGETFGALALMNSGRPPAAHRDWRSPPRSRSPAAAALALDNARLYGRQLEGRRDAAAQPAHPAAAARRPRDRRPLPAGRRPTSRSAATGTTPSAARRRDAAGDRRRGRPRRRRRRRDGPDPQHPARHRLRPAGAARRRSSPGSTTCSTGLGVGHPGHGAGRPRSSSPRAGGAAGLRTLRWSSAGHLPPLLAARRRHGRSRWPPRRSGCSAPSPPAPRTDHERRARAPATRSSSTPTGWSSTAGPTSTRASPGSPTPPGCAALPLPDAVRPAAGAGPRDRPRRRRHRPARPPHPS